jgi:hypothetical protein
MVLRNGRYSQFYGCSRFRSATEPETLPVSEFGTRDLSPSHALPGDTGSMIQLALWFASAVFLLWLGARMLAWAIFLLIVRNKNKKKSYKSPVYFGAF